MRRVLVEVAIAVLWISAPAYALEKAQVVSLADKVPERAPESVQFLSTRPGPDEALEMLKAGNLRFAADKAIHPHTNLARLRQAGTENQGNHAIATVLACSDSRVPVERIFDAGVMDIFVVRVAGNVCNGDQAGSIEYGLAHVNTPLLVVMGHTQCGAVTAVAQALQGKGHALERNIPGMIASIQPAVKRVMQGEEGVHGTNLIDKAIEENVWQAIENLFLNSPRTRELVSSDKVKVVGAIYDVGTGRVRWLPDSKVYRMLGRTESDPRRALNPLAGDHGDAHGPDHGAHAVPPAKAAHAAPIHDAHAPSHAAKKAEDDHGDAHAAPEMKGDEHGHGAAGAHKSAKTDPHGEAPKSAKTAPESKSGHDAHGDKGGHGDKNAHGDKAADSHGEKQDDETAEASEDGHGEGEKGKDAAADAAPAKSKPWVLIGAAGGIAVAGIALLLVGMKSAKAAPAADGAAHADAAPAPSPAAH